MKKHARHSWRLSLLAGLTALTMLFAGCAQGATGSTASPDSSTSGSGTGEVTTIRWITAGTPQTGMDKVMEEVNKILAERYGLKLKLETHVADVRNKQKDYNADNYQVALDAVVVKEGVYVYLVMSPAKDAIVKAIGDKLK